MELKLKIVEGKSAGQELKIAKDKFLVGRSEECHLRPHSEKISRHHCVIQLSDGMATIRDLGSKNGTFVNGERVMGEQELKAGDLLEFGPLKFEVRMSVDIKREKKPAVKSIKEAVTRTAQTAADDIDIGDWLSSSDPVPAEDDTVDVSRTHIANAAVEAALAKPAETVAPPIEAQAAPPPKKPVAKPKSADSVSAAAEAIRKFTQRR